jgi:hypothetical protein
MHRQQEAASELLRGIWQRMSLRTLTGGCDDPEEDAEDAPLLTAPHLGERPMAPGERRSVWTPWGTAPARPEDTPKPPPYAPPTLPADEPPPPPRAEPQTRRKRPLPPVHISREEHPPAHRPPTPKPEREPRRLGRSAYDAVETHGSFGLIDTGQVNQSIRELVAHVPKRCRGSFLAFRPGDQIHANSARGRPVGGVLDVVYITPHKYHAPGRAVTSCRLGVPDSQWRCFADAGREHDE